MKSLRKAWLCAFGIALALPCLSAPAEEPAIVDIDVSTSRVRGRPEPETPAPAADGPTVLPPPNSARRLPALWQEADRATRVESWVDACALFDQLRTEGGPAVLDPFPNARQRAGRAFRECAELAFAKGDVAQTENLLARSEEFVTPSSGHEVLRHRLFRSEYRRRLASGDVDGTLSLFEKDQALRQNDDERLWLGSELAELAWEAFENKDLPRAEMLLSQVDRVAPEQSRARELRREMRLRGEVLGRFLLLGFGSLALIAFAGLVFKSRAAHRIKRFSGRPKNKYLLDEEH